MKHLIFYVVPLYNLISFICCFLGIFLWFVSFLQCPSCWFFLKRFLSFLLKRFLSFQPVIANGTVTMTRFEAQFAAQRGVVTMKSDLRLAVSGAICGAAKCESGYNVAGTAKCQRFAICRAAEVVTTKAAACSWLITSHF